MPKDRVHAFGPGLADLSECSIARVIKPNYLSSADLPWLHALLAEREAFVGQSHRVWFAHATATACLRAQPTKVRLALRVLDRLAPARTASSPWPPAPKVRETIFRQAACHSDRNTALIAAAEQLGLAQEDLPAAMFADLPEESRLAPWPGHVDAMQLVLLCNEALIFDLLQRAVRVRIHAHGQVRAVVRQARISGLLCVVCDGSTERSVELEVSGPFALFRHSRLYGRALASLVPRLARCNAFRLEAECVFARPRTFGRLVVRSGDPIHPARELPEFDSRVEEQFARDFARLALEWDLIREPRALAVGQGLFFPDFELVRRTTGECYWLEIVGFWTAEYLTKKIRQLTQARLQRAILCVDESRAYVPKELQALGYVVRYRRRVDVRAVIAIVDPALSSTLGAAPVRRSKRRMETTDALRNPGNV